MAFSVKNKKNNSDEVKVPVNKNLTMLFDDKDEASEFAKTLRKKYSDKMGFINEHIFNDNKSKGTTQKSSDTKANTKAKKANAEKAKADKAKADAEAAYEAKIKAEREDLERKVSEIRYQGLLREANEKAKANAELRAKTHQTEAERYKAILDKANAMLRNDNARIAKEKEDLEKKLEEIRYQGLLKEANAKAKARARIRAKAKKA